jgi:hypothetical protein
MYSFRNRSQTRVECAPSNEAAIVDVYDAITSDRVYHKGMAPTEALRKLYEWSKFHFNPELVHAFVKVIGIYPVGTLVRMESETAGGGRRAAQVEHAATAGARDVRYAKRNYHLKPEDVDLSRNRSASGGADRIVGHESPEKVADRPHAVPLKHAQSSTRPASGLRPGLCRLNGILPVGTAYN